jgi:hypothetical protein
MKTALSFSIAGWLAFALVGCAGNDDGAGLSVPLDATPTTDADASSPANTASTPPAHSSEDISSIPLPALDPVDANADGVAPIFSDPLQPLQWRPCGQFEDRELQCAELEIPVE